jgi:hypothetical protein
MKKGAPLRRTELARGTKPLKRTAMKRGTAQMKRTQLARKTPVARENKKRAGESRKKAFGPQARLARSLPCCVCGRPPRSDPHHEPPRSRGGLDDCVLPLCASSPAEGREGCHDRRHRIGKARFWKQSGIDWVQVRDSLRSRLSAPIG